MKSKPRREYGQTTYKIAKRYTKVPNQLLNKNQFSALLTPELIRRINPNRNPTKPSEALRCLNPYSNETTQPEQQRSISEMSRQLARPKRLNNTRVKWVLVFICIVLNTHTIAQPLPEGWSRYAIGTDGKEFAVNLKTIKITEVPPSKITANIWELGQKNYLTWEIHCKEESIKTLGITHSIRSEQATVRRQILDGLCGFNYENAFWLQIGSTLLDNDPKKLRSFVFFNTKNLRETTTPFRGISVDYIETTFDGKSTPRYTPFGRGELVLDCENPARYAIRWATSNAFSIKSNASANTLAHSANTMFCGKILGRAIEITNARENPRPDQDTKSAHTELENRIKCTALGYNEGTEPYKRCINQLKGN